MPHKSKNIVGWGIGFSPWFWVWVNRRVLINLVDVITIKPKFIAWSIKTATKKIVCLSFKLRVGSCKFVLCIHLQKSDLHCKTVTLEFPKTSSQSQFLHNANCLFSLMWLTTCCCLSWHCCYIHIFCHLAAIQTQISRQTTKQKDKYFSWDGARLYFWFRYENI